MIVQTAAQAYAKYREALAHDALTQNAWHREEDGRQLACVLGVLGDEVKEPRDCPAQIMPRWLAQMVPWFFDGMEFDDAKSWGLKFYEQIDCLNGVIPFVVIHDWHATVVGPLAIEVAQKKKRNVAAQEALADMHRRAASGEKFTAEEWRPLLKIAFKDAYADAYVNAYANADAYADVYADAYANANADAYVNAYANAYAYAYADADAYANANANAYAKKQSIKRLADGMVACLARVALNGEKL